LRQICDRGGGLEFSVAPPQEANEESRAPDLVWRVRLLGVRDEEMLIESPATGGKSHALGEGVPLIGVMVIGQNRWMFRTVTISAKDAPSPWPRSIPGVRVRMPESVERCVRREFARVSTAQLKLPRVECWPLLEPSSVVAAEAANRAAIVLSKPGEVHSGEQAILPEVGPKFMASMLNIGGGGLGLLLDPNDRNALDRTRLLWLRVDLRPTIAAPIGMTAKVAHTHFDSGQNVYAGLAFEFAFNPAHRAFVVEQIEKVIHGLQRPASKAA
jgi:hypothetical protein